MKTLYLARHAKSSWEHENLSDFERPLENQGIMRCKKVIGWLKERWICPDLIISSPAIRAIETARLFAHGLGYPETGIREERIIYEGYYDRLLDIIYGTDNALKSLMLVGHNPTITHLANLFLHPGIEEMPTSAVVAIRFGTDRWEGIPMAKAERDFFLTPRKGFIN